MSRHAFRPHLEELGSRILPSASPAIRISDVALAEGHSGRTAYVFTVSLSEASSKEVSVKYSIANGSARTADGDFIATSGALKFAPGETIKQITVLVNGDRKIEADEQFFVNLTQARNAAIANAQSVLRWRVAAHQPDAQARRPANSSLARRVGESRPRYTRQRSALGRRHDLQRRRASPTSPEAPLHSAVRPATAARGFWRVKENLRNRPTETKRPAGS
jgi:hypothetical protein